MLLYRWTATEVSIVYEVPVGMATDGLAEKPLNPGSDRKARGQQVQGPDDCLLEPGGPDVTTVSVVTPQWEGLKYRSPASQLLATPSNKAVYSSGWWSLVSHQKMLFHGESKFPKKTAGRMSGYT
ncbi:unnamed protein product [Boreogadus saida]